MVCCFHFCIIFLEELKFRDAKGYCFQLPVNRSHLPVTYRLTDKPLNHFMTNVNGT